MSTATAIEWTNATWNPVTGCDQVSAGCDHCYALTLAKRLKAMGNPRYQNDGRPETSGPGFGLTLHPDKLEEPLRWAKPRRVFVNSMSDLFHADVPREYVVRVFAVMALAQRHTFQILTKRPARMRLLLTDPDFPRDVARSAHNMPFKADAPSPWPLPNVWLGVSVEDQEHAPKRIGPLVETPAAVRFLSCEPLLGPLSLRWGLWEPWVQGQGKNQYDGLRRLDWVIVGGESGAHARTVDPAWVRKLRDECVGAGVPFFFKQWGGHTPKAGGRELDGRTWDEYPASPTNETPDE